MFEQPEYALCLRKPSPVDTGVGISDYIACSMGLPFAMRPATASDTGINIKKLVAGS